MPITWVPLSESGLRREWLDSRNVPLGHAIDNKTIVYVPSWATALYKAECGGGSVGAKLLRNYSIEELRARAIETNKTYFKALEDLKQRNCVAVEPYTGDRPNKGLSKEQVREIAIQLRRVTDPDGALKAALVVLAIVGFQSALTFLRAQE